MYLQEDLRRYFRNKPGLFAKVKTVLLTQGIWATIVFRLGSWCHDRKGKLFVVRLLLPFLTVIQKITEIATGIVLPFTARIGKGLYIGHFGCIILSHKTVMGDYCNISQGVTIGQAGRGERQTAPIIGSKVYIGPGAKVIGGIRIGDCVAIGANAVVTKDLPDNAVAVGVPAKIISHEGSSDFIILD